MRTLSPTEHRLQKGSRFPRPAAAPRFLPCCRRGSGRRGCRRCRRCALPAGGKAESQHKAEKKCGDTMDLHGFTPLLFRYLIGPQPELVLNGVRGAGFHAHPAADAFGVVGVLVMSTSILQAFAQAPQETHLWVSTASGTADLCSAAHRTRPAGTATGGGGVAKRRGGGFPLPPAPPGRSRPSLCPPCPGPALQIGGGGNPPSPSPWGEEF